MGAIFTRPGVGQLGGEGSKQAGWSMTRDCNMPLSANGVWEVLLCGVVVGLLWDCGSVPVSVFRSVRCVFQSECLSVSAVSVGVCLSVVVRSWVVVEL